VLAATGPFFTYPLEDAFAVIADAGFDGAEAMVTTDRRTQDPAALMSLSRRHGVPLPVLHGPFLLLTRTVFGTDPRGKMARSVDLAEAIGARTVVTHAPYRWEVDYTRRLPDEIARIQAEREITVAVENMYPVRMRALMPNLEFSVHEGLDLAELRRFGPITLDTSHLAVAGLDLLESYRQVARHVAHVHASNNAGIGRDSHAPLDTGVLPVCEFLEELGASAYRGDVTLELNLRSLFDDRKRLVAVLRENVELARAHLAAGARRTGAATA
jgi:sugar phosphate isomerase/epimerase